MGSYVVLNDGDTFTPLKGCQLVIVREDELNEDEREELEDGCMAAFLSEARKSVYDSFDLETMIPPSIL